MMEEFWENDGSTWKKYDENWKLNIICEFQPMIDNINII